MLKSNTVKWIIVFKEHFKLKVEDLKQEKKFKVLPKYYQQKSDIILFIIFVTFNCSSIISINKK